MCYCLKQVDINPLHKDWLCGNQLEFYITRMEVLSYVVIYLCREEKVVIFLLKREGEFCFETNKKEHQLTHGLKHSVKLYRRIVNSFHYWIVTICPKNVTNIKA